MIALEMSRGHQLFIASLAIWCLLLANVVSGLSVDGVISLYDPNKDDIHILNSGNFDSSVYDSDYAWFVEFYAHWCGACQRYSRHWRELAQEAKLWQVKVVKIAAINCGDTSNSQICSQHDVSHYPTLKYFSIHADKSKPGHDSTEIRTDKTDVIMENLLQLIEKQPNKPASWPDLEPYTSKRLDTLFIADRNIQYGFIILEEAKSDIGKKLILDFSPFSDKVVLRRTDMDSNPSLFTKFDVYDKRNLPMLFLVNNTAGSSLKQFEKFDEKTLDRLSNSPQKPLSAGWDDYDSQGDDHVIHKSSSTDPKQKMSKLIRLFLRHSGLVSTDELMKLQSNVNALKILNKESKKEDGKKFLKNMQDKIYMQDLESGLNQMIRFEIPHTRLISNEKLNALKEWMRVLAKYFPGRKSVRNFLNDVYNRIESYQVTEITGNQWSILVDEHDTRSFLPNKTEWIHCKGSDNIYRGYPCSLWLIFHVMTVSQLEIEKESPSPFDGNFNIREVVEAIRGYVFNFFGCRECAENFKKETSDYLRYLSRPYDAIQYIWKVHNSVNKRLARESITGNDPAFPKVLFPTQKQCPKCYLPSVRHLDNLADHESPFQVKELLLFLSTYFSKYHIEPIQRQSNSNNLTSTSSSSPNENWARMPNVPDAVIDKLPAPSLSTETYDHFDPDMKMSSHKGRIADERRRNMDIMLIEENYSSTTSTSFDLKLSSFLVLLIIITFVLLFIYFARFRRRPKLAKYII